MIQTLDSERYFPKTSWNLKFFNSVQFLVRVGYVRVFPSYTLPRKWCVSLGPLPALLPRTMNRLTVVTSLCISIGLGIGWTSPYLALLSSEEAPFPVTHSQISWIAALQPFGRIFGAVIGSIFVEYFGTKMSLLLTGLPLIVGWICVILANSVVWLYIFRIFSGTTSHYWPTSYPKFPSIVLVVPSMFKLSSFTYVTSR